MQTLEGIVCSLIIAPIVFFLIVVPWLLIYALLKELWGWLRNRYE